MKSEYRFPILAAVLALSLGATTPTVAGSGAYPGANGQPFQALQGQITDLETYLAEEYAALWTRIDELQQAIDSNNDRDDAQDAIISLLGGALADLEVRVSDNEDAIAALEAKDQVLAGLITALQAKVDDLQSQITAQGERIDLLVLQDQYLQQLIGALNARVETLEEQMTDVNADIAAINSEITSLKSRISSAEVAIAGKQNRIYEYCPSGQSIWKINADGSVECAQTSGGFTSFTVLADYEEANANAATAFATTSVTATCPSGSKRTGGGFALQNDLMFVGESRPDAISGNGWKVIVRGSWPVSSLYRAYIVCLTLN